MERFINSNPMTVEKRRSLSPKATDEVRVVGISEYEQAAQCLALAFAEDDVARYFVTSDDMIAYSGEYKWKLHCDIIRYITAAHCYKGIVTTLGPDYDAVALWMPPGKNMDDWWTIFRSGMWRLYFKLSKEGRKRFFGEFFPLLHYTKTEVMKERDDDSYYLVYIGSKPSARGKGYARKLIEHMTVRADHEGRAVYLESSAHANVTYYVKHGFCLKREIQLTRGQIPIKLGIMVREPQLTTGSSEAKQKERALTCIKDP